MRAVRDVKLGGVSVQVKELTLGEIRAWLKSNEEAINQNLVDCCLFDDFNLGDIAVFCDISAETLDALTPSDLRNVVDSIKEVNPHFFALRGRLVVLGTEYRSQLQNVSRD